MASRSENVKWVDGLRGCASLLVVFTHIARAFDVDLFKPASAEGAPPRLLQYPFLRILVQGRIGVSIFSLVTGYVCALKPIRQIRSGDQNAAFNSISRSAFRRVPRLILPTTIATILIWIICQFGVFEVANHVESQWLNHSSPNITPFIGPAFRDLVYNIISTWTKELNMYDINQWTLFPLLKGSMMVYVTLVATAYCKSRYRLFIELGLFLFGYISKDATFGMLFFFGVFLSDLSQHPSYIDWLNTRKWTAYILSPILIIFGLFLASYPEDKAQWARWSEILGQYSIYFFPKDNETPRYYSGVGLIFICLVYLLHGTLLRTLLVWMYFGFFKPPDIIHKDGRVEPGHLPYPGRLRWYFWMPIWFVILYWIANLWTKYVDPWCARLTEALVRFVFEESPETSEQKGLPM